MQKHPDGSVEWGLRKDAVLLLSPKSVPQLQLRCDVMAKIRTYSKFSEVFMKLGYTRPNPVWERTQRSPSSFNSLLVAAGLTQVGGLYTTRGRARTLSLFLSLCYVLILFFFEDIANNVR